MATTVTLKPNAVDLSGSTSGTTTLQASAVAGTTTVTLPAATDTLVGKATTDTLTNKTLTSPTLVTPVLGTPASGTVTNLTGTASININGTVGATTATTGAFTTVTGSGNITTTGGVLRTQGAASGVEIASRNGTGNEGTFYNPTGVDVKLYFAGADKLTVTSTGLNSTVIGATTPAAGSFTTLSTSGDITSTSSGVTLFTRTGASTAAQAINIANTTGAMYLGVEASAGGTLVTGSTGYDTILRGKGGVSISGDNGVSVNGRFSSTGLAVTGTLSATGTINGITVGKGSGAVATNTAIGVNALLNNTTGSTNTAVGTSALQEVITGAGNTSLGWRAGYLTTGDSGTFIGYNAGSAITTGVSNVIVGGYTGNMDGLDIRTAANYAVIADGEGHRQLTTKNGYTLALGGGAVPNSGTGITFPATQNASADANTLDDYEEGTWTPGQGSGLTLVGAFSSAGKYTKIGRQVFVSGFVAGATSVAAAASSQICDSLPFAASTVNPEFYIGSATNSVYSLSSTCMAYNTSVYATEAITATPKIWFSATYTV